MENEYDLAEISERYEMKMFELTEENADLRTQLAEARKDSERFEWMVSYDGEVRNLSCTGNSYCYAVYSEKNGDLNYEYSIYGKTPREAIDNAMKGGE